ncbi:MAG: hypothetical protein R3C60_12075 [Parvularculaceae bacterium]
MIDAAIIEGHETPARRRWLFAAFAALFLAAQLIFAAHTGAGADALSNHAADTCVACMASASAPDPVSLVATIKAPTLALETIEFVSRNVAQRETLQLHANSRAPPVA